MSDMKKLLSKSEEAEKPTEGERELLIKSLLHQSMLHNRQGDTALALLFTSAAQELESLQAENAELRKRGEWISVDDELPELNKTVMIDSGSGFDFARFNGEYWTRKGWPLGYTPKYWMPLPTPPKGE